MQHYWRSLHTDPKENTPVYLAHVVSKKHENAHGIWWQVLFYNHKSATKEGVIVYDSQRLTIREGTRVFIHGSALTEVAPM